MAVSKSKLFFALLSMHSLMVACTAAALIYAAVVAPWSEPLLYISITVLFVAYYFYGGALEMRIYRNDSVMHQRLLAEMRCLSDGCVYRPTPYLLNANMQTLFAATGRPTPNVRFVRELVPDVYPDGELCRLDWSMAPSPATRGGSGASASASVDASAAGTHHPPVVIVFHGLTGGSDDSNMHYITQEINQKLGWHVVIPVRRGCGDEATMTVPKFYAYGGIEDTEHVVEYVAAKMANHVLFGVGISAGSNILANYLGTYGSRSRISGAISIANGYCWDKGTRAIQDHHPVWDAIMSGIVHHTLFRRHRAFHETLVVTPLAAEEVVGSTAGAGSAAAPPLAPSSSSPLSSSPSSSTILVLKRVGSQREMDEAVSRRLHGFDSLEAFYRHQSCEYRLANIAVPTIFLNALDDPLAHFSNIPTEILGRNPNTLLVTTACGGHLGWAEGWWPFRNQATWMDRFIVEALESMLRLVNERREGQCMWRNQVGWKVGCSSMFAGAGGGQAQRIHKHDAVAAAAGENATGGGAATLRYADDASVTPRTTPAGQLSDGDSATSSRKGCGEIDSLQASLNSPPRSCGPPGGSGVAPPAQLSGPAATNSFACCRNDSNSNLDSTAAALGRLATTSRSSGVSTPQPSLRRNGTSVVFGGSDTLLMMSGDAAPKLSTPPSLKHRDDASYNNHSSSSNKPSLYGGGTLRVAS